MCTVSAAQRLTETLNTDFQDLIEVALDSNENTEGPAGGAAARRLSRSPRVRTHVEIIEVPKDSQTHISNERNTSTCRDLMPSR